MNISFDELMDDMKNINDDSSITVKIYTHLMHLEVDFARKEDIKFNKDAIVFVSYGFDKMYQAYISVSENVEKNINENDSISYTVKYPDLTFAYVNVSK